MIRLRGAPPLVLETSRSDDRDPVDGLVALVRALDSTGRLLLELEEAAGAARSSLRAETEEARVLLRQLLDARSGQPAVSPEGR